MSRKANRNKPHASAANKVDSRSPSFRSKGVKYSIDVLKSIWFWLYLYLLSFAIFKVTLASNNSDNEVPLDNYPDGTTIERKDMLINLTSTLCDLPSYQDIFYLPLLESYLKDTDLHVNERAQVALRIINIAPEHETALVYLAQYYNYQKNKAKDDISVRCRYLQDYFAVCERLAGIDSISPNAVEYAFDFYIGYIGQLQYQKILSLPDHNQIIKAINITKSFLDSLSPAKNYVDQLLGKTALNYYLHLQNLNEVEDTRTATTFFNLDTKNCIAFHRNIPIVFSYDDFNTALSEGFYILLDETVAKKLQLSAQNLNVFPREPLVLHYDKDMIKICYGKITFSAGWVLKSCNTNVTLKLKVNYLCNHITGIIPPERNQVYSDSDEIERILASKRNVKKLQDSLHENLWQYFVLVTMIGGSGWLFYNLRLKIITLFKVSRKSLVNTFNTLKNLLIKPYHLYKEKRKQQIEEVKCLREIINNLNHCTGLLSKNSWSYNQRSNKFSLEIDDLDEVINLDAFIKNPPSAHEKIYLKLKKLHVPIQLQQVSIKEFYRTFGLTYEKGRYILPVFPVFPQFLKQEYLIKCLYNQSEEKAVLDAYNKLFSTNNRYDEYYCNYQNIYIDAQREAVTCFLNMQGEKAKANNNPRAKRAFNCSMKMIVKIQRYTFVKKMHVSEELYGIHEKINQGKYVKVDLLRWKKQTKSWIEKFEQVLKQIEADRAELQQSMSTLHKEKLEFDANKDHTPPYPYPHFNPPPAPKEKKTKQRRTQHLPQSLTIPQQREAIENPQPHGCKRKSKKGQLSKEQTAAQRVSAIVDKVNELEALKKNVVYTDLNFLCSNVISSDLIVVIKAHQLIARIQKQYSSFLLISKEKKDHIFRLLTCPWKVTDNQWSSICLEIKRCIQAYLELLSKPIKKFELVKPNEIEIPMIDDQKMKPDSIVLYLHHAFGLFRNKSIEYQRQKYYKIQEHLFCIGAALNSLKKESKEIYEQFLNFYASYMLELKTKQPQLFLFQLESLHKTTIESTIFEVFYDSSLSMKKDDYLFLRNLLNIDDTEIYCELFKSFYDEFLIKNPEWNDTVTKTFAYCSQSSNLYSYWQFPTSPPTLAQFNQPFYSASGFNPSNQ